MNSFLVELFFFPFYLDQTKGQQVGHFTLCNLVGSGTYGQVWRAVDSTSFNTVAIKVVSKEKNNSILARTYLERELSILKTVDHPFTTELFEFFEDDANSYLVIEFCPNGSLLDLINGDDYDTTNEFLIQHIFCQLIITILFLQTEMNIIHRDLKAENILFDEFYNIRIIDFGLSTFSSAEDVNNSGSVGTPSYSAPEILKRDPHDFSVDIWSAGILLYTMCVGKLPFNSKNEILNSAIEFPEFIKPDLKDLISKMLQKNPKDRIKITDIISHPWFPRHRYEEIMEYIKSRGKIDDFDFQLDMEIVSKVQQLGLDTDQLSQQLFLHETDEVVAIYREFRNMKEIENLKRFDPFQILKGEEMYSMKYSLSMDQVNYHNVNRYPKKQTKPIFVFNIVKNSQSNVASSEDPEQSSSKYQCYSDYSEEQMQQEWLKKDALLADEHQIMIHTSESDLSHFNDGSSMRVLPKKSFMRHRISAISNIV